VIYDRISACDKIESTLDTLRGFNCKHLTIGALLRLSLDTILPSDLDKVLYLDSDTLVLSSLRELWNKLPYEDYAIVGSCPHPSDRELLEKALREQKLNPKGRFPCRINSGVLLLDLRRIREENLLSQSISWLREHNGLARFPDQDAINAAFRGRILMCETRYGTYSRNEAEWSAYDKSEKERDIHDPTKSTIPDIPYAVILHFVCPYKPWNQKLRRIAEVLHLSVMEYIALKPPTTWHRFLQESPWKKPKYSLFLDFFIFPGERYFFFFPVVLYVIFSSVLRIFSLKFLRR
jgi:lipopolysaccharide biosynthesis glycosyltransferase